jgi:hypothetical protein
MSIRPGSTEVDSAVKKVRSAVDGTTTVLKCGIHEFETEDQEEFNQHMHKEDGHYEHGRTSCMICGQQYHFKAEDKTVQTKHVKRGIAMHPECKAVFFKDISS